jgi:hypothetical protein
MHTKLCEREIFDRHYATAGYRSDEFLSVNRRMNVKLRSMSRTSGQSSVSVYRVYSER